MNPITIILTVLISIAAISAVIYIIRRKSNGCSGDCSHCNKCR